MIITKAKLSGVCVIEPNIFEDNRGLFVKTYNEDFYKNAGLQFLTKESYYSISKKNVVRGMHFQSPPMEHIKLVYVVSGSILDVVLDIRKGSPTYGLHFEVELSDKNRKAIYVPTGYAHGFLSLENNSCVVYSQSSVYSQPYDYGVKYDSFGMKWGTKKTIVSPRDSNFPTFQEFKSPFKYST